MRIGLLILALVAGPPTWAAPENQAEEPVVKYKAGKELNFEQLVIEGQLKRPELSVVTGDSDENGNGLLRLRENFVDRMAEAAGQEAP
jgi:hypothetical protein